jgi:hypothetical protein
MADNLINHLEPGEEVIAVMHEYWVVIFIPLMAYLCGWVLFLLVYYFVDVFKPMSVDFSFGLVFLAYALLFAVHHLFFAFLIEHFLSPVIVSNKRLIKIRCIPYILNDISFVELMMISQMDENKSGLLKNIFNYGDISLNFGTIKLNYVRSPSKFINFIEILKSQKPLARGDLKNMDATVPEKYKFLLE